MMRQKMNVSATSWCAALVAAAWLNGATAAPAPYPPPNVQRNIAYGPDPAQSLDLYPAAPGAHPLVIYVHGGGWVGGNKGGGRRIALALNAAGYTVASIGYRLVPQSDVAGAMQDLAQATAYLQAHALQLGIVPAHFAVMGHSSGAHMAALLGTDQSYLRRAGVDPAKLAVVITLDGVYDIKTNVTHYPSSTRTEVFGMDPQDWARYSPIDHIADMTSHPLFCPLHEDHVQRFVEQAAEFEAALTQHKEHFVSAVAPGLNHGQLVGEFDNPAEPMQAFTLECLKKAVLF